MSRIDYAWQIRCPLWPGVYVTRRGQSNYKTRRYWDGKEWFEIAWSHSRGGVPFKWPKNSPVKKPRRQSWMRNDYEFFIRKIHVKTPIQWGEPFTVYDEKEVLKYLIETGVLPFDWKTAYQKAMRTRKGNE